MWISRLAFDTLVAERIKATAEATVLAHQNSNLTITLDWFRHRTQQLEQERAHLLATYMGVKVQVPTWVAPEPNAEETIGGANIWNDIGDAEAQRRGIKWDEAGAIVVAK